MNHTIPCSLVLTVLTLTTAQAEKNVSLDAKLGKIGKPTIQESFDRPLSDLFRGVKGEWSVGDGVLNAKELVADKHAAVLNVQQKNRDSIARLSFRFEGTTQGLQFSLNHAKGHLFRVIVSPEKLQINLDKDKKDPASKAMVLGTADATFSPGEWYTLQVEMKGQQVVAQTDNGAMVNASHPKLDTDKPNYRVVMRGDSLTLDDMHVWELH